MRKEAIEQERERKATEHARMKEAISKALEENLKRESELMTKRQLEHQKKVVLAEQRFKEDEAKEMLQKEEEILKLKAEWDEK